MLLPTQPAEIETFARLWQRESLFLPLALYVDSAHRRHCSRSLFACDSTARPPRGGNVPRRAGVVVGTPQGVVIDRHCETDARRTGVGLVVGAGSGRVRQSGTLVGTVHARLQHDQTAGARRARRLRGQSGFVAGPVVGRVSCEHAAAAGRPGAPHSDRGHVGRHRAAGGRSARCCSRSPIRSRSARPSTRAGVSARR